MLVTLSWLIPLGALYVIAASFPEGNHLAYAISDDRAERQIAVKYISLPKAVEARYLAVPWFFVLDESGQRKQTVCYCNAQ